MKNKSHDFFSSLKTFILPSSEAAPKQITNNIILNELLECFDNSCKKESVGTSLLFNMHFIIILHPDQYEDRLASFPVIVKEAVKGFYKKLAVYKKEYEDLSPVSFQWHFKFGPGSSFNEDRINANDIRVIGMLTGLKSGAGSGNQSVRKNTAKVTMKSKLTNVYEKLDINLDLLRHINFFESGTFSVRFNNDLQLSGGNTTRTQRDMESGIAHFEYFLADKNVEAEYLMKDKEIVIARKETANQGYSNYLLIESTFISDPHARVRLHEPSGKFQIASFSRFETRVNEVVIPPSEPGNPKWFDLNDKSQILLNSSVTLKFTII
jgi:hypothetical protein